MQYVVTYDIADERRRSHLAKTLLDFGARIEESVFVANLDDQLAAHMLERIRPFIEDDHDCAHVFQLCAACASKTTILGTAEVPRDQDFYVL